MSETTAITVDMPRNQAINGLIDACVVLGHSTTYSETDIRFAAEPFVRWAVSILGVDPDLEELFTTRNIEQFVHASKGAYSTGVLGNVRSRLFRLAERIADPHDRRPPVTALPAANPSKPYKEREIAAMLSWANSQRTPKRRASARNLLALGLGAGLSTSEIANLRNGDVTARDAETTVRVTGARAREVVMLRVWADELTLDDLADAERYVFRPDRHTSWRNVVSNFVGRLPDDARPQPQRLRATWIVGHLSRGVNVSVLMRAAGVDSLEALTRYVQFVDEPAPDLARISLLGGDDSQR